MSIQHNKMLRSGKSVDEYRKTTIMAEFAVNLFNKRVTKKMKIIHRKKRTKMYFLIIKVIRRK